MYKSDKTYSSIKLFMDDFLELEDILKDKFELDETKMSIDVNTPKRDFPLLSMYELLDDKVPKKINSVSIRLSQTTRVNNNYIIVKYIKIYISDIQISVNVEGIEEVWVNGMEQILKDFFKERKSVYIKVTNLLPFLGAGLIGMNATGGVIAIKDEQWLSIVLSGILLIVGIILTHPTFMRMCFPPVVFELTSKKQKDWRQHFWTVTGTIATVIGTIATLISLWK